MRGFEGTDFCRLRCVFITAPTTHRSIGCALSSRVVANLPSSHENSGANISGATDRGAKVRLVRCLNHKAEAAFESPQ